MSVSANEPVMREAEQRRQPYLFKLRLTKGVKRAIERAMGEQEWQDAGGQLRLGFAAIDGGGEAWEYVWPRWRGGEGLGL
jgi:hypothetical protein